MSPSVASFRRSHLSPRTNLALTYPLGIECPSFELKCWCNFHLVHLFGRCSLPWVGNVVGRQAKSVSHCHLSNVHHTLWNARYYVQHWDNCCGMFWEHIGKKILYLRWSLVTFNAHMATIAVSSHINQSKTWPCAPSLWHWCLGCKSVTAPKFVIIRRSHISGINGLTLINNELLYLIQIRFCVDCIDKGIGPLHNLAIKGALTESPSLISRQSLWRPSTSMCMKTISTKVSFGCVIVYVQFAPCGYGAGYIGEVRRPAGEEKFPPHFPAL